MIVPHWWNSFRFILFSRCMLRSVKFHALIIFKMLFDVYVNVAFQRHRNRRQLIKELRDKNKVFIPILLRQIHYTYSWNEPVCYVPSYTRYNYNTTYGIYVSCKQVSTKFTGNNWHRLLHSVYVKYIYAINSIEIPSFT